MMADALGCNARSIEQWRYLSPSKPAAKVAKEILMTVDNGGGELELCGKKYRLRITAELSPIDPAAG